MSFGELRHIDVSYDKKTSSSGPFTGYKQRRAALAARSFGCGKTTTLRVIAGLIETSADVRVDGADMTHVPVHIRDFGMVFSKLCTVPPSHRVREHRLRLRQRSSTMHYQAAVGKMVDICDIAVLRSAFPNSFRVDSGNGWRWRGLGDRAKTAALGRALSNLDAQLRLQMRLPSSASSRNWDLDCLRHPRPGGVFLHLRPVPSCRRQDRAVRQS